MNFFWGAITLPLSLFYRKCKLNFDTGEDTTDPPDANKTEGVSVIPQSSSLYPSSIPTQTPTQTPTHGENKENQLDSQTQTREPTFPQPSQQPHKPPLSALSNFSSNVEGAKRYVPKVDNKNLKKIHFAAGCFWSVELAFQRVRGVFSTTVGYTQGHLPNPVYEDVKKGTSGHVETVEVSYNESLVSLETLLETFWWKHDASSKNKQGNDKGTQYRSGVYYFDQSQKEIGEWMSDSHQARWYDAMHHLQLSKKQIFHNAPLQPQSWQKRRNAKVEIGEAMAQDLDGGGGGEGILHCWIFAPTIFGFRGEERKRSKLGRGLFGSHSLLWIDSRVADSHDWWKLKILVISSLYPHHYTNSQHPPSLHINSI